MQNGSISLFTGHFPNSHSSTNHCSMGGVYWTRKLDAFRADASPSLFQPTSDVVGYLLCCGFTSRPPPYSSIFLARSSNQSINQSIKLVEEAKTKDEPLREGARYLRRQTKDEAGRSRYSNFQLRHAALRSYSVVLICFSFTVRF